MIKGKARRRGNSEEEEKKEGEKRRTGYSEYRRGVKVNSRIWI
jgi:hypothetical protein